MNQDQILPSIQEFIDQQVKKLAQSISIQSLANDSRPCNGNSFHISFNPQIKNPIAQNIKNNRKGTKYRTYSSAFKRKAVSDVLARMTETGQSLNKVVKNNSRRLGIHPKNLQRWYRTITTEKREFRRKPAFPEMEEQLMKFVRRNPKIKRRDVIDYSKKIMKELLPEKFDQFQFSKGWYERFKNRCARKQKLSQEQELGRSIGDSEIDPRLEEKLKIESGQVKIEVKPKILKGKILSVLGKNTERVKMQQCEKKCSRTLPLCVIKIEENQEQQSDML